MKGQRAGHRYEGVSRHGPFDGDAMLSVILSKALLLADDHRITDPTILARIN